MLCQDVRNVHLTKKKDEAFKNRDVTKKAEKTEADDWVEDACLLSAKVLLPQKIL